MLNIYTYVYCLMLGILCPSQIVWKATVSVGCGYTPFFKGDPNYDATYAVCEYWPPGNQAGSFDENLFPPGRNVAGASLVPFQDTWHSFQRDMGAIPFLILFFLVRRNNFAGMDRARVPQAQMLMLSWSRTDVS